MQFSDETLMAYADGEVDADTRRQIEAAMARDPTIAERVAKHRALRVDLGAAFGGVLDEPVPSRLLDAANSTPAAARPATVTDLRAARAAKAGAKQSKSWSWPQWTAIAASLLIGVLAGRSALQPAQSEMFATTANGIVASGDLSAALNDQLSGTATDGNVRIGLSFRSKDGDYCRSFAAGTAAGFACREDAQWRVRALNEAATPGAGGEYRMAGTELPPAVLAAIDDVMEGEALDREQEQAARERGWNK
jgi:anti-sigma factor RsiW